MYCTPNLTMRSSYNWDSVTLRFVLQTNYKPMAGCIGYCPIFYLKGLQSFKEQVKSWELRACLHYKVSLVHLSWSACNTNSCALVPASIWNKNVIGISSETVEALQVEKEPPSQRGRSTFPGHLFWIFFFHFQSALIFFLFKINQQFPTRPIFWSTFSDTLKVSEFQNT